MISRNLAPSQNYNKAKREFPTTNLTKKITLIEISHMLREVLSLKETSVYYS